MIVLLEYLCVCVVCVYVSVFPCACIHIMHAFMCACVYLFACMHICMCVSMYFVIKPGVPIFLKLFLCRRLYVCMYVCMCECLCVFVNPRRLLITSGVLWCDIDLT